MIEIEVNANENRVEIRNGNKLQVFPCRSGYETKQILHAVLDAMAEGSVQEFMIEANVQLSYVDEDTKTTVWP